MDLSPDCTFVEAQAPGCFGNSQVYGGGCVIHNASIMQDAHMSIDFACGGLWSWQEDSKNLLARSAYHAGGGVGGRAVLRRVPPEPRPALFSFLAAAVFSGGRALHTSYLGVRQQKLEGADLRLCA